MLSCTLTHSRRTAFRQAGLRADGQGGSRCGPSTQGEAGEDWSNCDLMRSRGLGLIQTPEKPEGWAPRAWVTSQLHTEGLAQCPGPPPAAWWSGARAGTLPLGNGSRRGPCPEGGVEPIQKEPARPPLGPGSPACVTGTRRSWQTEEEPALGSLVLGPHPRPSRQGPQDIQVRPLPSKSPTRGACRLLQRPHLVPGSGQTAGALRWGSQSGGDHGTEISGEVLNTSPSSRPPLPPWVTVNVTVFSTDDHNHTIQDRGAPLPSSQP